MPRKTAEQRRQDRALEELYAGLDNLARGMAATKHGDDGSWAWILNVCEQLQCAQAIRELATAIRILGGAPPMSNPPEEE
jgi:hypothetical protein